MPVPNRTKQPTALPDLHWLVTDDGSLTLWNSSLDETYHSGCGAVAESLVVYLSHSGVLQRLTNRQPTRVFELGLGTATAFLLTAAIAEHFRTPLEFWAIELRPLPSWVLSQVQIESHLAKALRDNSLTTASGKPIELHHFGALNQLTTSLIAAWSDQLSDFYHVHEFDLSPFVRLRMIVGDATRLDQHPIYPKLNSSFDAVYFDAFSPESSPELWTFQTIHSYSSLLVGGGSLTSYCVKSSIRKTLEQSQMMVRRLPGPVGGKREVLAAQRCQ
ncbi:MAG: tRNA (5-methylaminomethyl-2-thiouridine)(34)-methyltransferase MnmD [Pirellulales bacterium]